VSDPAVSTSETELRPLVERALSAAYELDREIGRGGMGIVYRAKDRRLKRHVAIKLLPPELAFRSEIRSRFLREAETAAQLSHPNIVPIYSVDESDGLVYFVMACVDGENLGKRIHDRGPLPLADAREILAEVSDALAYAHARGVVHRDIKPDNILLDGADGRALVTDFGIARAIIEGSDARLTATGMAIGTPAYMSPEQSAGDREIDGRTDLYSLGIVAYQMLTGELPFTASSTPAMLVKHISEAPTPIEQKRADIPVDLARAVMILLAKDPGDRFPSAGSLVVALDTGVVPEGGRVSSTSPVPPMALAGRPSQSPIAPLAGFQVQVNRPAPVAAPDSDDVARWNAPQVIAFRRKLAPYLSTALIFFVMAILPRMPNLLGITAVWTVYIAWRYAKLWAEGYDWKDVFKQPRDRFLVDVVSETIDDSVAMFDPKKREELRARRRLQGNPTGGLRAIFESNRDTPTSTRAGLPATVRDDEAVLLAGSHARVVQEAIEDRNQVLRLLSELPREQRDALPDVGATASALADKIRLIAQNLADLERSTPSGDTDSVDREIAELEAQANPLDPSSEQRVRRLSQLRRQRRALGDVQRRRDKAAQGLETCRLALHNMRLDILRLKAGQQSHDQITTMTERANDLAREVDAVVYAGDQMMGLRGRRSTPGPAGA
jgi:serine/threonine-protein kinase